MPFILLPPPFEVLENDIDSVKKEPNQGDDRKTVGITILVAFLLIFLMLFITYIIMRCCSCRKPRPVSIAAV